jgi:hypothetical protein
MREFGGPNDFTAGVVENGESRRFAARVDFEP